jgi:ABC-type antimicrobial peptide transport system permease subunit
MALGEQPRGILNKVLLEGFGIGVLGVAAGFLFALVVLALARLVGEYLGQVQLPGALPLIVSAAVILAAAVIASVLPAARAARVDAVQALRSE